MISAMNTPFHTAAPCALLHVLHVEHDFGKSFIEDARLHFERNLRAFKPVFEASEGSLRLGRNIHTIYQSQQPGGDDENRKYPEEAPHAHAAGAHGGDFAVGGEAAEADQDSDQHAHGQRVSERQRDGEGENFSDAGQRSAGADHQFENLAQIAGEQDEGEDGDADEGVRRHFAQNVAGENPHGRRA